MKLAITAALLLRISHNVFAQTLRMDSICHLEDFLMGAWYQVNDDLVCYGDMFDSVDGGPTTAQLLIMFTNGDFIESKNGNVYTVYGGQDSCGFPEDENGSTLPPGIVKGLYEVIDMEGSCVLFRLLFEDDFIGQIVPTANAHLAPIEVIGIDKSTNKIYGYYPDQGSAGGLWKRKSTIWGDATDGTMTWGPNGEVGGVSKNGRMFNLWGNFESFNYAKHNDILCNTSPTATANIEWGSPNSRYYRGLYCVDDDGLLSKYTWKSNSDGGPTKSKLDWEPADKISRLTETSNIYGISKSGTVVALWNCGDNVFSAPIRVLSDPVDEVAGIDDKAHFFTLTRSQTPLRVNYVYRDGDNYDDWKALDMSNAPTSNDDLSLGDYQYAVLGNFDDHVYMLSGFHEVDPIYWKLGYHTWTKTLYRLDTVDGPSKFELVEIQTGVLVDGP
ncbi:hypothetical protein ACHAXS_008045 [Conticribra weissflogii]